MEGTEKSNHNKWQFGRSNELKDEIKTEKVQEHHLLEQRFDQTDKVKEVCSFSARSIVQFVAFRKTQDATDIHRL